MNDLTPKGLQTSESPPEVGEDSKPVVVQEQSTVPTTGRRQALKDVRRQLKDEELAQSGTQKMLLEMLEEAEADKDSLKGYVLSYHEADKKCAILGEKLNADRSVEIFFGVGVGLGGTLLGFAPSLWTDSLLYGIVSVVIGSLLIIGSCIGRAVKR